MNLEQLLAAKEIVVCCGSGGVGKTSTAAAAAAMSAVALGAKTLVLTVDPAIPLLYVPELFTRGYGLRTTRQIAEALSAELGY